MFLVRFDLIDTRFLQKSDLCPCGRLGAGQPLLFMQCCGQYLDDFDAKPAPDPLSLMRSRYSAFVLQRERYLLDTWSVEERPSSIEFDHQAKWLGLEGKNQILLGEDRAEVEFVARYRLNGRATRIHENSPFIKNNHRWFYEKAKEGM